MHIRKYKHARQLKLLRKHHKVIKNVNVHVEIKLILSCQVHVNVQLLQLGQWSDISGNY